MFGVKVAPAIFQQVMDTMLGGLDFAITYLDDIIIASKNISTKYSNDYKTGFKVKENKCKFFLQRIKYLGHIIDKDGRHPDPDPDPDRATAIKDMPALENTTQLPSFLGLTNYYQSFKCTSCGHY